MEDLFGEAFQEKSGNRGELGSGINTCELPTLLQCLDSCSSAQ